MGGWGFTLYYCDCSLAMTYSTVWRPLIKTDLECRRDLENTLLDESALGVVEVGELGRYADDEYHAVQHLPSLPDTVILFELLVGGC